jgi:hypothetical protein
VALHLPAALGRLPFGTGTSGRRNWLILVDTGTTALTGVVLLVGAARSLAPEQLSSFALGQLMIVTAVGILRTALFGPALAAQRTTGRSFIPLRWTGMITPPAALVVSGVIVLFVPSANQPRWLLSVVIAAAVYLAQDGIRNVLVSRNQPKPILIADLTTGVIVMVTVALQQLPHSPSALMAFWGAAAVPGLVYAMVKARRGKPEGGRDQTLSQTWRLGRWGAVDASLAAVASLLPMIVSTALVSATASGTYRVLQSALGPLNIVFSTVLTVLMLDSWHASSEAGLTSLRHQVKTILLAMVGGSLVYLPVALTAMVWLSQLHGPEVVEAAVVVGAAGLLGAAATPFTGAALARGRQHWGVVIRVVTVAIAVGVSIGSGAWVPFSDPIGLSMLGGAVVVLVGWAIAYTVADRQERHRLLHQAATPEVAAEGATGSHSSATPAPSSQPRPPA